MRVKQIDNALDLFELFSRDRNPLTLTAIAIALAIPKSSAFNIIETLKARGYLHETRRRGGYYPTLRLANVARAIAGDDLLVQRLHPELEALAGETGETVLLATREQNEVVYIDVVESTSPIRYSARIGERRLLHRTSSGKAVLLSYEKTAQQMALEALRPELTATEFAQLLEDLKASATRGWTEDPGNTMADVTGFGAPIVVGRWRFGLAIAGPTYRMKSARRKLVTMLVERCERINSNMAEFV